jgi:hypothetical protein
MVGTDDGVHAGRSRNGTIAIIIGVAVVIVAGLVYAGLAVLFPRLTVVDTGGRVVLTKGRIAEEFVRGDEFRGVFMVFGGNGERELWNEAGHAFLAGLTLADAQSLSARYPDFYMCASPGAARAKDAMVHMSLVAADALVRERIDRAIRDHDARIAAGGKRLCVTIAGHRLRRLSHRIDGHDAVVTELTPFTYVAVQRFDAQDCQPLLANLARD